MIKKAVQWKKLEGAEMQWVAKVPGGQLFKEITTNDRPIMCFVPEIVEHTKKESEPKVERVSTKSSRV